MSTEQTVPLEPDGRIQIPSDWAEAFGFHGQVTLERTDDGILVRPGPRLNGASQAQLLADLKRRRFTPPPGTPDSVEMLREDRQR